MVRLLAKVSEEETVAINEAAFFFYPSDLVNTKTTVPLRDSFASPYISTTIHLPFGG